MFHVCTYTFIRYVGAQTLLRDEENNGAEKRERERERDREMKGERKRERERKTERIIGSWSHRFRPIFSLIW